MSFAGPHELRVRNDSQTEGLVTERPRFTVSVNQIVGLRHWVSISDGSLLQIFVVCYYGHDPSAVARERTAAAHGAVHGTIKPLASSSGSYFLSSTSCSSLMH